jgi:hypothetical protein
MNEEYFSLMVNDTLVIVPLPKVLSLKNSLQHGTQLIEERHQCQQQLVHLQQ